MFITLMVHPDAERLIPALVEGDPHAYAALFDRLGHPLWRIARSMLRSADEADDCVQDLFVELVRRRDRLARVLDLDAYLFSMLRHAVYKRIRRTKWESGLLRRWFVQNAARMSPESSDDIETALAALPLKQREVIAMKIDGQLTFAQIAQVLGVSPNTAASRYRYALEKLRSILE